MKVIYAVHKSRIADEVRDASVDSQWPEKPTKSWLSVMHFFNPHIPGFNLFSLNVGV